MDSGPYSLCPSRQLGSGFPQIEPPRITVEAPSWLIPAWQTQKLPKPQWANLLEHGPSTWPLNSWRNKLHALSRGLCKAMCKGAWTQGGVKNGGQLMQSASHRWEANKGDMDWAFLGKKQKLCEQQLYREFNWIWGENRWQNDNCDHVAMKHPKVRQLGCESRKVYELFRQVNNGNLSAAHKREPGERTGLDGILANTGRSAMQSCFLPGKERGSQG